MTLLSERRSQVLATRTGASAYVPLSALVLDLTLITAVGVVATWGRSRLMIFDNPADLSSSLTVIGPLVIASWVILIALSGGYRDEVFGAGTDEYKRLLRASLLTAGLLGVGCYLAKFELSRAFFVLVFALGVPALLLGRLGLRRLIHNARRRGRLQLRVVISGLPAHVDEVATVLAREPWLGYSVIGALTPGTAGLEETPGGVPVVGTCDETTALVEDLGADVIFFASGALTSSTELRRIAWDLAKADVQVVVAPRVTDVSGERVRIRPVGGLPLMHIEAPRSTDASRLSKRLFDVVGSMALLVAFSPLLALAALQIRLYDGGPVFFRQTRVGRDGAKFDCIKLRTMVTDAEERLADLHAATGYAGGLFKLKDDPRVTTPGRWLRRYSMDELPQLLNVLRGDMSLVGPRPPLPHEVASYDTEMQRRLRVPPGMTGLWQVSGRSDLSWAEAVRLDLYYVDNWSMLQDLSILVKTFGAVFGSRGAY